MTSRIPVVVRPTIPSDFADIISLTAGVYPGTPSWTVGQLESHRNVFPEGQLTAVREDSGAVAGMAASLIVLWDDYDLQTSWRDFTDAGMFTNHDPSRGRTLYGAEIMVDPALQGQGIGSALYSAREALVRERGLLRIRAGARLRDYHTVAETLTPSEYVDCVIGGRIVDRTLSFQLHRGFRVVGLVSNYLRHDPESLGHAAVIEWVNEAAEQ